MATAYDCEPDSVTQQSYLYLLQRPVAYGGEGAGPWRSTLDGAGGAAEDHCAAAPPPYRGAGGAAAVCANGGQCKNMATTLLCVCPDGFRGPRCAEDVRAALALGPTSTSTSSGRKQTRLVVAVATGYSAASRALRDAARQSWWNYPERGQPGGWEARFMLGAPPSEAARAEVEAEREAHGDLVVGWFHDSYYNLTLKSAFAAR
jgi:hypothetical protein